VEVADFMEEEEDFMGVAANLAVVTLEVGGAVATAGMEGGMGVVGTVVVVTGAAGTDVVGTGAARIGTVDTPIGGGVIRILTGLTVGSQATLHSWGFVLVLVVPTSLGHRAYNLQTKS
jgi:hypothetical protein